MTRNNDSTTEQSRVRQTFKRLANEQSPANANAFEAVTRLLDISEQLLDRFSAVYARYDLSRGRIRILITLLGEQSDKGLQPTELAELCGISRATVTGVVDTLEQQGLVERAANDGDRRTVHVRLTPEGRQRIDAIFPEMMKLSEQAFAELAADERLGLLWTKGARSHDDDKQRTP